MAWGLGFAEAQLTHRRGGERDALEHLHARDLGRAALDLALLGAHRAGQRLRVRNYGSRQQAAGEGDTKRGGDGHADPDPS